MILLEAIDFIIKYILPVVTFFLMVVIPFGYKWARRDITDTIHRDLNKTSDEIDNRIDSLSTNVIQFKNELEIRVSKLETIVDSEKEKTQGILKKLESMEQNINSRLEKMIDLIINRGCPKQ